MKESHYNTGDIEVIDFIRDQLTPEEFNGFCKGNILKYVPRSNHKGDPIADAQKVRDYADYWINANLRTNKVAELGQVSTEKAQELADTIVELRRANVELKEGIETRKADIKHFRKRIDELRDDKLQLEKLNEVRGEQREKYQHENVKLKEEINELKDELRKSEEENVKASRERLSSVKMAEALRESVDRLQKEKESHYAKFVEVQAQHEPPIDEHVREEHRTDPAKIDYDKFKNA